VQIEEVAAEVTEAGPAKSKTKVPTRRTACSATAATHVAADAGVEIMADPAAAAGAHAALPEVRLMGFGVEEEVWLLSGASAANIFASLKSHKVAFYGSKLPFMVLWLWLNESKEQASIIVREGSYISCLQLICISCLQLICISCSTAKCFFSFLRPSSWQDTSHLWPECMESWC
jgi:hypothetical protein